MFLLAFPLEQRAHIMGVVVSETTRETRMATEIVTANSRNRRPTMPPINRMGVNTVTSETLMESTVKPISPARARPLAPADALFQVAGDVFDHDNGVIHHEPGRNRQRHERKVVQAVAEQVHDAEGPDERNRHRHAWNEGRAGVAQKDKHHQDDQPMEINSVISTSWTEARMVVVRSSVMVKFPSPAGGSLPAKAGPRECGPPCQ
jgi:hypothetical protein